MRRRTAGVVTLVALALVLAGCAAPTATEPDEAAAPADPAGTAPAEPPAGGDPATTDPPGTAAPDPDAEPTAPVPQGLDFELPALTGETVRGADYAGSQVILWFWAPW